VVAVTDPDDFFGQLDEVEAVTDDQTDSIETSVEQTEADALRADADTTASSTTSTEPRRQTRPIGASRRPGRRRWLDGVGQGRRQPSTLCTCLLLPSPQFSC